MTAVLFVCVRNGGKSQMAAGLLRKRIAASHDTTVTAASAGTAAGSKRNELSAASLAELGATMTDDPRQLTPEMQQAADWIITLGSEARVEPLPGPQYEVWETDEPSQRGIDGIERMRLIRDDIALRVDDLYRRITPEQA